jgi:dipeptidyl aminopeptidase/acylaminoacyl peptidase
MLMDRQTKATHEALAKFDFWVDEFTWSPDARTIYFISGQSGEAPVLKTTLSGPGMGEASIALKGGEFVDVHVSPDGNTLVASRMTAESPATIVSAVHAADPAAITHVNDALLDQLDLSKMQSFRFPGAGNTSVQGFIIRPPNFDPNKKYPLKFLIHGGPQGAWGDAWSYRWNPELMAASGYVVVMINPRGSTGYGQKFIDQISGDWGGRPYIDLMKGLDAAEAKYPFIDKSRECALGASYGGYMANWVLTHTDRFKCIVTHDGMYNPESAYGDTEEMWFNEWEFRRPSDFPAAGNPGKPAQPWRYATGPVSDDPFRKWSPMLHIQNAKTPTLIIHSQLDYRLDVSEGFQLFTALQRLGVPSKMLYFPDEGHWVQKPKNAQLWNRTVADWCDRWTHSNSYAPQ